MLQIFKTLWAPVLLIAFCNSAYAIHGEYVEEPALADSVCMITVHLKATGKAMQLCSSTIVNPYQVITAAHCKLTQEHLDQNPEVSHLKTEDFESFVTCPKANRIKIKNFEVSSEFGKETLFDPFDVAIANLETPLLSPFIPLPVSAEKVDSLFAGNNCLVFGYGKNDDGGVGVLRGVKAEFKVHGKASSKSHSIFLSPSKSKILPIDHGDSGGGVYCRDDNGKWFLMGVVSRTFFGWISAVSPVFKSIEWFQNHLRGAQ